MKTLKIIVFCCLLSLYSCSQNNTVDYFGQKTPNNTAIIFAPEIISTENNEFTPTFIEDESVFYFSRKTDIFKIYEVKNELQGWSEPKVVPFSGIFDDVDCVHSPDGTKLFFASKRSLTKGEVKSDYDFWSIERTNEEWAVPYHEGDKVNSQYNDLFSSVSNNGTKYFDYNGDIYKSVFKDGRYLDKEKLGDVVNTSYLEKEPFISPDESYLIFVSDRPENNLGDVDLYICFKQGDDQWSKPINMGSSVNSTATDQAPVVTLDKKYLFFSSRRKIPSNTNNQYGNGSSDIYWVSTSVIESLKAYTFANIPLNSNQFNQSPKIDTLFDIEINGLKQKLLVQSDDLNNPVILWLHGGAGTSEMFINHYCICCIVIILSFIGINGEQLYHLMETYKYRIFHQTKSWMMHML